MVKFEVSFGGYCYESLDYLFVQESSHGPAMLTAHTDVQPAYQRSAALAPVLAPAPSASAASACCTTHQNIRPRRINPILAIHRFLDTNQRSAKPLGKHIVLAHVIKAFNAWKAGESLKRIKISVDDRFPILITSDHSESESEE